jgi:hypothetical protein
MPSQSLASPNRFPAEFALANRDRFECRQRLVRVLNALEAVAAIETSQQLVHRALGLLGGASAIEQERRDSLAMKADGTPRRPHKDGL